MAGPLSTIRGIKRLPSGDNVVATAQIEGVVTYSDPDWRTVFVQDKTGGLRIPMSAFGEQVPVIGQRIHMDAEVGAGGDSPLLIRATIRSGNKDAPATPHLLRLRDLSNHEHDSELVQVKGVLQQAEIVQAGRHRLLLSTGDGKLTAVIADSLSRVLHSLVDAEVALTGVVCRERTSDGSEVLRLWLRNADDIQVLRPPPEFRGLTVHTVAEIIRTGVPDSLHRVGVQGVLRWQEHGAVASLTDSADAITVRPGPGGGATLREGPACLYGFLESDAGKVVLTGAVQNTRPSPPPVLTEVWRIHALSPVEAMEERPVRISGVVTYFDRAANIMFVQDRSGGIYLPPRELSNQIAAGDRVDVEGVTGPGEFAPVIASPRVTVLGAGIMPTPSAKSPETIFTGNQDGNWIQLDGVVTAVQQDHDRAEAQVAYGQHSVTVLLPASSEWPDGLLDASVRFLGACGSQFNLKRQLIGINLFVPGKQYIHVLKPAPVNLPSRPIRELFQYSRREPGVRSRVEGIITLARPEGPTFIQDTSGGILILDHPRCKLRTGDRVRALGTVGTGASGPFLKSAEIVRLGAGSPVRPVLVAADEAIEGWHDEELIQVEGTLTDVLTGVHGSTLVLESRGTLFTAQTDFSGRGHYLEPGSRLRLTGVCDIASGATGDSVAKQFEILLRDGNDIEVLKRAPWWNPRRTMMLAAGLGCLILIAATWMIALQRQVARQTIAIRKNLEHAADLEGRLAQARKLESIGRLAGGVAHDFNNLLTVINGYTELLLARQNIGAMRGPLEQVRRAGERAAQLTEQLLDFSRKRMRRPEAVDLNGLICETEPMIRQLVGDSIVLTTRLAPGNPLVTADQGQLHRVLMNLSANARDAMPSGGMLSIETSVVELNGDGAHNPQLERGPYVMLTAMDTGVGMDAEVRKYIFEPFFTTKDRARGAGLGLATVYGIVQQSLGSIDVESEPGHGTTFRILLPRTEPGPSAKPTTERVEYSRSGTILVVEDSEQVRKLAVDVLSSNGFRVLEASDGASAIEIARSGLQSVQLLLTDVVMPGMNGRQLAAHLRGLKPDLKILYMSGHSENVITDKGVLDPGITLLPKPFTTAELLDKVSRLLES